MAGPSSVDEHRLVDAPAETNGAKHEGDEQNDYGSFGRHW
jgi:hypothetical protein